MDLSEAIRAGYVDDSGRLSKLPAIQLDGRAIIPYGVRSLGKGCIHNEGRVKYLFLPDTLEEMEAEAVTAIRCAKGVVTYSASDDPMDMEITDRVCDLRGVRRFTELPMMGPSVWDKPLFDEVIISADAEIKAIRRGCDGPIKVVGEGTANASVGGALCFDNGETLALFPHARKPINEFVVPETVKRIAPRALNEAVIYTVILSSSIEEICPRAFEGPGIRNLVIPAGIKSFAYKTTRNRSIFGATIVDQYGAFSKCLGLESVKIAEGIKTIAKNMFHDCDHLIEINIPESLSAIEEGAFGGCAKLSLIIPENVKSVAPGAFGGAKSVVLPSTCANVFEDHLSASKGTVVAVVSDDGTRIARAGYTPPEDNLTRAVAAQLSSGIAFEAIDARFHDGGIKKFEDKIRVAITRLVDSKRGHAVNKEMSNEYASYVKRNARKAAKAFEEEGDIVCSRIIAELGYDAVELARKAIEDAAKPRKPKKPSVAQLTKAAIEAMRKGDSSKLVALEPVAGKVNPLDAIRLLKYAAMRGDAETINQLYAIFGKFEMPSIALCYAIACGNDGTARTLIERDVTLGKPMDPIQKRGDTPVKQANRLKRYIDGVLFEDAYDIPGWMGTICQAVSSDCIYQCALSSESDDLVVSYAEEGLLDAKDLKGLMLASLAEWNENYSCGNPKPELALLLAKCGGLNDEQVWLHVQRGSQYRHADIRSVDDLLYPGCSTAVAKAVCSIAPDRIAGLWDGRFLRQDPEVVRILVPHLDLASCKNTGALLNLLAKNGYDAEIKMVCQREGLVTEKMMQKAIEAASTEGKVSTTALLMSLKASMFEGESPKSLEL